MDEIIPPTVPVPTQKLSKLDWLKKYRKTLLALVAILVLGGAGLWGYNYYQKLSLVPKWEEQPQGLVNNKVSHSAAITVNLPDSVKLSPQQAEAAITFEPKVLGTWSEGPKPEQLLFKPENKLDQGKYYRISLSSDQVHLAKDFLADEDPKIVAIFPNAGSEAPETSDITIEFNRPMVALTTLDAQLKDKPPVEITPATPGKFKWITTRTLQFLPEQRLKRSSNYKVKVNGGLVSMDGLTVETAENSFTTRPLRYEGDSIHHSGFTLYDEPVTIRFNQPVDLAKTTSKIEVTNQNNNSNVAIVTEYGTRAVYLGDQNNQADYTDKSVINIYQKKDSFGRDKFWDNKTNYNVTINGAVPLDGDIELTDSRNVPVTVPDILQSAAADSPRSNLVEPSLFDPKGHLILNFYEDINKDSSQINAPGLKQIDYGQQCKLDEDGNQIYQGGSNDCQKEDNKKQLLLSFNENNFKAGQDFDVVLNKIVNVKGLQLNRDAINQSVEVYPALKVLSTSPAQGQQGASVTELTICTNSPLLDAQLETFNQMFKSNQSVGKWNWAPAYKAYYENDKCPGGQYVNSIAYGLHPETQYQLELNLVDHFGQKVSENLSFTSGKIDSLHTSFHSLQKNYNVATPRQTKLTFAVENLDYVDLQVCQVSPQDMLGYLNPNTPIIQTTPGQALGCQQSWEKRITLPPKYWDLNYFQVDLKDIVPNLLGYYVLSFSNPNLKQQIYNYRTGQYDSGLQTYERSLLNITNLAAQEKKVEVQDGSPVERQTERAVISQSGGNLYWVSQIGSLDPLSGAQVQVYQRNDKGNAYNLWDSGLTDQTGVARLRPYSGDGAAVVSKDGDSTIVSSYNDKFQWADAYPGGDKAYIYSDRPIYRPGQQIFIKGLYRIGYDGVYEIYKNKTVHLQIYNSSYEVIDTEDLKLNSEGTFNTSFTLPSDARLGSYHVEALGGYYSFEVQEYKPAAFKVDSATDKEEYIAGDDFKLNVDANYYFGVPVESGQVQYSVLAQDYYFDRYSDQNFQFGGGWYYSPYASYGDNFILRGKAPLGQDGKAQIVQNLDFNKFFNDQSRKQSKIFVIRTTVTNGTGQSVSGEKSFIVHRGEFYLGVNLEKPYFGKSETNKLLIKSVNTQGKETGVGSISGKVSKVKWNYFKRQEVDGQYYYTSEKQLEKVQDISASTDSHGNYATNFTVKDEGEYEIDISAKDSRGNEVSATQSFYVYGQGTVDVQPLNNDSLDIAVENSKVSVGQKVNLVIKSPFKQAKALIAVERGRILDYKIVNVDQNFFNYSLDVKEAYIPNFFVTVLLISPDPQVKFGQAQFFVDTKEKTLTIEAKPEKNNYLPGEQVVLDVTTKDSSGRGVSADVSLSVADLSVLALAGNPKKDPVSFFYDGRPLGVTTASNLKNILAEAQIPTGTKGGGGANPDDLATKKRGVFKDTAYWNADVITDSSGHAQVKFTLPDNLTTWQVEGLGLTDDTKLGVGYSEFQSKKQLMVVPLVPRFVIPGDEFVVGGKVFNQTGDKQKLTVTFQSESLTLSDKNQQTISLDSGQTSNVYFKVKAPVNKEDGVHTVTITAKNDKFQDSVESSFPINRNETYEAVATSNYTTQNTASEYVWLPKNVITDKGGVTIKASATLAKAVPEALNYLVAYPYGCTEQMMSKLESVAIAKRFTQIKNLGDKFKIPDVDFDGQKYSADDVIKIGLARVMANQTYEGGFSYYPNMKPDFYLTLDVLNSLEQLRKAGYAIDSGVESRAVQYAYQEFSSHDYFYNSKDTLILTAYTFSNVPSAGAQFAALKPRVLALDQDKVYFNETISNLSLTYLALMSQGSFRQEVFSVMQNRIVIDGRGAYLGGGDNNNLWQYYETPIKDTALFVKAFANAKQNYPDLDKVLRWLQNSRSKDGAWGSTSNTASVLDALVDYLQFKPENLSNFTLALLVDGKDNTQITFGANNILDNLNVFIPTSAFTPEKLSEIKFNKTNLNSQSNGFYYDMSLKYYLPIDSIAPRDEGFAVERELYGVDDKLGKTPVKQTKVGQVLRGHLKITVTKPRNFVAVESFIPAGMELVNFGLATEDQSLVQDLQQNPQDQLLGYAPVVIEPVQLDKPGFWTRTWRWTKGVFTWRKPGTPSTKAVAELPDEVYSGKITNTATLYPDSTEYHDDRLLLFNQHLDPGVYEYDYFVRALIPGKFQHLPAVASELYLPENFGRSRGEYFQISQ